MQYIAVKDTYFNLPWLVIITLSLYKKKTVTDNALALLTRNSYALLRRGFKAETLPFENLIRICMLKFPKIKCKHAIDDSNSCPVIIIIGQCLQWDQVTPS